MGEDVEDVAVAFPLIVGPHIVLEIALRQRERATKKAIARHERRERQRK